MTVAVEEGKGMVLIWSKGLDQQKLAIGPVKQGW